MPCERWPHGLMATYIFFAPPRPHLAGSSTATPTSLSLSLPLPPSLSLPPSLPPTPPPEPPPPPLRAKQVIIHFMHTCIINVFSVCRYVLNFWGLVKEFNLQQVRVSTRKLHSAVRVLTRKLHPAAAAAAAAAVDGAHAAGTGIDTQQ